MNANMKQARKLTGIAKFERECTCSYNRNGRMTKRCTIPGTQEHGKWEMLKAETFRVFEALENGTYHALLEK